MCAPKYFICYVCPPHKIFIDRDPTVFAPILNFLRTKELDPRGVSISLLLHEAQFYGITPLGDDFGGLTIGGILGGGPSPPVFHILGFTALFFLPPQVRRLQLREELDHSSCGSVLFNGYLPPPGKSNPTQHHVGSNHPLTPLPKFLLLTSPNSLTSQTP